MTRTYQSLLLKGFPFSTYRHLAVADVYSLSLLFIVTKSSMCGNALLELTGKSFFSDESLSNHEVMNK